MLKLASLINEGTWKLPYQFNDMISVRHTLRKLKAGKFKNFKEVEDEIYQFLGTDSLFDSFIEDEKDEEWRQSAFKSIQDNLKQLLKDYRKNPKKYKERFNIKSLKLGDQLVKMRF